MYTYDSRCRSSASINVGSGTIVERIFVLVYIVMMFALSTFMVLEQGVYFGLGFRRILFHVEERSCGFISPSPLPTLFVLPCRINKIQRIPFTQIGRDWVHFLSKPAVNVYSRAPLTVFRLLKVIPPQIQQDLAPPSSRGWILSHATNDDNTSCGEQRHQRCRTLAVEDHRASM